MTDRQSQSQFLIQAGASLLEYNESSGAIIAALVSTAKALTREPCHVVVSYRGLAVSVGDAAPVLRTVKELRLNAEVQTRIHGVLDEVRAGRIDAAAGLARLELIERDTPRHSRWLVALLLGGAAGSFARLLGADAAAMAVAGISTAIGFLIRQELGRRHVSLLALPLAAACIGALLGGIAIRLGWTRSPELVLVVPALMLVPGPHLLNGLFDLVDNHLPMSLSRLGLAMGILLASALGIVLGVRMTLPSADFPEQLSFGPDLNLLSDMLLAGIATCGFASFFNASWYHLAKAAIGGMTGHGLRFLALQNGFELETATFFGGLAVGAISAWMARTSRAPVAVIAFAGAVTMIPGPSFYRALGGALRLARLTHDNQPGLVAGTLGQAFQACAVVSGLALGLVLGIRAIMWLLEARNEKIVPLQSSSDLGTHPPADPGCP
jgi:uncharacterized membrane protein YjjP (DUF1212 family)